MILKLKVGDKVISAETGKMYIVEKLEGTEYKCKDVESNSYTWLIRSMVNSRRFYRIF